MTPQKLTLQADVSLKGLGAVLLLKGHLIYFTSKSPAKPRSLNMSLHRHGSHDFLHTEFYGFIQDLSIFLPYIQCLFIGLNVLHLREYLSYCLLVFKLVLNELL